MISPETIERIKALMEEASVFEEDLDESFILGGGPGGQKTNKTSNVVRLSHEPSGLMVRCGETRGFLRQTMKRYPDIEQMEELKAWLEELEKYMDEAAYKNAKSYDSRRRTPHAALAAWEIFLKEHPASPHADEARARIAELSAATGKETSK